MIIRALKFVLGIGWQMAGPVRRRVLTWYHQYLCQHLTLQLTRHLSQQLAQQIEPMQHILHRIENDVALELDGVVRELARLQMQVDSLLGSARQDTGAVHYYLSPDEPVEYDRSVSGAYLQETSSLEGHIRAEDA